MRITESQLRKIIREEITSGRYDVVAVDKVKFGRSRPDVKVAEGLRLEDAEDLAYAVTERPSEYWRDGNVIYVDLSYLRKDWKKTTRDFLDGVEV
jgi:hypothetical protein